MCTSPRLTTFTRIGARSSANPRVMLSMAPDMPEMMAKFGMGRVTTCAIGDSSQVTVS